MRLSPVHRKEVIYFTLVTITSILSLLKTGFFAYVLPPVEFGYLSLFLVVTSYLQYSQLGVLNGIGRELPIAYGSSKNKTQPLEMTGSVFKFLIYTQIIFAFIYLSVIIFLDLNDKSIVTVLIGALFFSIFSNLYSLVTIRLRSELKVVEYAIVNFLFILFSLLVGVMLAYLYGYKEAIISIIVITLICFTIVHFFLLDTLIFSRKKSYDLIRNIMIIGTPMMIASGIQTLLFTIDKLFIASIYTMQQLGEYSFASIPMAMGITLSGILGTYFTPQILHNFGKDGDLMKVYNSCLKISFRTIFTSIILFPVFYLIVDFVLPLFFSDYINAKSLLLNFYVAGSLIAANIFSIVFLAAKRTMVFVLYEATLFLLALISFFAISIMNYDVISFVYTLSFLFCAGFLFLWIFARVTAKAFYLSHATDYE